MSSSQKREATSVRSIAGQIFFYGLFIAFIGVFSRWPSYQALAPDRAEPQLGLARLAVTGQGVMLLDEPLAGMGSDESARMVEVLKRLKPTRAILLVEHDMDAVFAVADTITVMVNGQVLESGPPEQIKASVAVQQAYLGQEDSFHV